MKFNNSVRRYFTSGEVIKLTGVTYRRLDRWVDRGLVTPSGRNAKGFGQRRLFTFRDVVEVETLRRLTAEGVRLSALMECVANIRSTLPQDAHDIRGSFAKLRLVSNGKQIYRYLPDQESLISVSECGQFAFAFGLGDAVGVLFERAQSFDRRSRYATTESIPSDVARSGK